jgi:hypothetical protein
MSGSAPGIQQNIYLDGIVLAVPAERVKARPARAETAERLLNSYAVIDRPFAFDGAPTVITKYSFEFAFPSIAEADYRKFTEIESRSGFLDLCLWKPITETFSGDGLTETFTLLRREALSEIGAPYLPADAATLYETICTVSGVEKTITLGTPDAATGRTPFTLADPPAALEDNVRVFYVPLFLIRILDPEREFSTPFIETATMRGEEA